MADQAWTRRAGAALAGSAAVLAAAVTPALAAPTAVPAAPALTSTAAPAVLRHNGLIAFESRKDIWTIKPDGTGLRRLTTGGLSHGPDWSPDGTRIVFSRNSDIWVMTATGGSPHAVTTGAPVDRYPSWSPDGRRIAFVRTAKSGPGTIWAVPATGGTATQLSPAGAKPCAVQPTWTPSGTQVVYVDECGTEPAVMALTVATRKTQLLIGRSGVLGPGGLRLSVGGEPQVTTDGKRLVFDARDEVNFTRCDIAITDLHGHGFKWLTDDGFDCEATPNGPFLSPDGTKMGYVGGFDIPHFAFVTLAGTETGTWITDPTSDWLYAPSWQPVK